MILTKKQITELLNVIPSEKSDECTPTILEIRTRLKDELDKISKMDHNGDDVFTQFIKRVGHFSTKDYDFQYVDRTNGIIIIRKSTGLICATVCDNNIHIVGYDKKNVHIPKFVICRTCGMPIQEGYLFNTKDDDNYSCQMCFSTKMNTKYGKGKWQFTPQIKIGDDE